MVRRKVASRKQHIPTVLLAPIPNPLLHPSPFLRPPVRSATLYRLEDRRASRSRKYSDSTDVAHQFRQFSLGPSPPLLAPMDSDCSPMDDRHMTDVEQFDISASKIRRKSVNKVKVCILHHWSLCHTSLNNHTLGMDAGCWPSASFVP